MNFKLINVAILSVLVMASCSKDEVVSNADTSSQNAISFNALGSKAQTKATPITSANLTTTDFDVFAYNSETHGIFMGSNSQEFAHDGVHIHYNGTIWDYKNSEELAYWPTVDNKLNFYAVSPVSFDSNLYGFLTWLIHSNTQQIKYTTIDEFGSNSGAKNIDVMYAVALNQTKETNSGKVKFNFKHIMSQVLFKARVEYESMAVTIRNIKMKNFYISGTFTFPAGNEEPTYENWNLTTHISSGGYTVGMRNASIVADSKTEPVWISDETNPMLFHPQRLTKWTPTKTSGEKVPKSAADNEKMTYLIVNCKIEQNGLTLHDGDLYIPFGATWQPGNRYIYTLVFGGGFNEHGDPILTPIEFDAEVTDWVDATDNSGDLNTSIGGVN